MFKAEKLELKKKNTYLFAKPFNLKVVRSFLQVSLECTLTEDNESKLLEQPTEMPPDVQQQQNATRPVVMMKKKVQMIANCSCSSCHGHHGGHSGHHALGVHHEADSPELLHQQHDVPELMGLVQEIQTRKMTGAGHAAPHLHLRANNRTLHELLVSTNLSEGNTLFYYSKTSRLDQFRGLFFFFF